MNYPLPAPQLLNVLMDTLITDDPLEAAQVVRQGGVVAFPTETVYGLGAEVFNQEAVAKIYKAKGRPVDNPLIVHISEPEQTSLITDRVTNSAQLIMEMLFPGPVTVILPRHPLIPSIVSAGLDTVAIRMPSHPTCRVFLEACKVPVAAPSANLSGRPSPTIWQAVRDDLEGRINCILRGGPTQAGIESTVVDCTGEVPVLLRSGAITVETLKTIVPDLVVDARSAEVNRSPGMKYRHYAPNVEVALFSQPSDLIADRSAGYIGLTGHPDNNRFGLYLQCTDTMVYAHELFRFFRLCEEKNLSRIYCQRVPEEGLGRALMDRLTRAASATGSGAKSA